MICTKRKQGVMIDVLDMLSAGAECYQTRSGAEIPDEMKKIPDELQELIVSYL